MRTSITTPPRQLSLLRGEQRRMGVRPKRIALVRVGASRSGFRRAFWGKGIAGKGIQAVTPEFTRLHRPCPRF